MSRRSLLVLSAATLAVIPAAVPGSAAVLPSPAERIAKLTGPESINATDTRFAIKATDLGVLWDNGAGQVLAAFGDTYGAGWTGPGGGAGDPATIDWRCNTLLRSSDRNLADGITFDSAAEDRPGHAKQFLDCKKIDRDEHTVIPTAGISVGSRQYVHYMSVSHWGPAGTWFTKYSGIAYSDDNGNNWTKHPTARWQNTAAWDDKFQMTAFARSGGFVYMFGTPNGRFGNVHVARVPERQVLTKTAYRYWNGTSWSSVETAAAPIATAPVSEVSVQYNTYLGRWLMMYLNEHRASVVLRSAPTPTGPWSGEEVVARGTDYPGLYGTFIHPWSAQSGSPDLYFVMSQWDPYNVYLLRTRLTRDPAGVNVVGDPGFEEQGSGSVSTPWLLSGRGGIDRGTLAHTGRNNAWVRESNGWHTVYQTVAVRPNHRYRLSAWIRTADNSTVNALGIRNLDARILAQRTTAALSNYTQISVDVEVGRNPLVQVYAGVFANGQDAWLQVDDVSFQEVR